MAILYPLLCRLKFGPIGAQVTLHKNFLHLIIVDYVMASVSCEFCDGLRMENDGSFYHNGARNPPFPNRPDLPIRGPLKCPL